MKTEFIPYEQALALKELGFDDTCHSYYSQYGNKDIYLKELGLCNRLGIGEDNVLAPLYQQAFKWFREKHKLFGQVNIYTYFIYDMASVDLEMIKRYDTMPDSFEEAELACLRKLIEIVKEK